MDVVSHTKTKLTSVIDIVDNLQAIDFPHTHPRDVLEHIHTRLNARLSSLNKLRSKTNTQVANVVCKAVLQDIFLVYPLLGFVLRSTNVRNSFEIHGPFLRLVNKAIGKNAKLVISSEWQFSPFTYSMPDDLGLNMVVFIGVPVTESGNGLTIPLTGHEFGHNLWRLKGYAKKYNPVIKDMIVEYIKTEIFDEFADKFPDVKNKDQVDDIIGQQNWKVSWAWAMNQCEEIFCDSIGLIMYREAYLHSFAYLLAPGLEGARSPIYPQMSDRINAMMEISRENEITVPSDYQDQFEDSDSSDNEYERFLVKISDVISKRLVGKIGKDAKELIEYKNLNQHSPEETKDILRNFSLGIPAVNPSSISTIVNAAWLLVQHGMSSWESKYPKIFNDQKRSNRMLSDLIFKSIEVLEINEIQQDE